MSKQLGFEASNLPAAVIDSDSAAWHALLSDTQCCVAILDRDGRIQFANDVAVRGLGVSPEGVVGRSLSDFFSADWAEERIGFIRQALATRRPVVVLGVTGGSLTRTTYRPLPDASDQILAVCHHASDTPGEGAPPSGIPVVHAKVRDLGPLATLTDRETEVLRLIGEGLSTAQIAERLHRSAKTIEWHRVALGSKLGVRTRVELARIAIRAGLSQLDIGLRG